jgi:hypothetical protein
MTWGTHPRHQFSVRQPGAFCSGSAWSRRPCYHPCGMVRRRAISADRAGNLVAKVSTQRRATAHQPRTGQEPMSFVPVRAGRSRRSLPVADTGRSSGLGRRLGPSMPPVVGLPGVSRLARSADPPRYLLCVSDGRLPTRVNPAFRGPGHSVHGLGSVIIATSRNEPLTCNVSEPPTGIELMTYALRGARDLPVHALAAPIAQDIALGALAALGLPGDPFHARGPHAPSFLLLCVTRPYCWFRASHGEPSGCPYACRMPSARDRRRPDVVSVTAITERD